MEIRVGHIALWGIGFALAFGAATRAFASEGMFGYIYTLDNTPEGQWEYEQKHTYRQGKARGRYHAVDLVNEFEYGITNNLQVAFYLHSLYLSQKDVPDENTTELRNDHDEFNVRGTSVEFLYRLLSPYTNSLGVGLYAEPELIVTDRQTGDDEIERAVEARLILQKNFLGDTLVTAFNLMVEPEWVKEDGGHGKELYVEYTLGANYRLRSNWFVGLEVRNHNEFPDMNWAKQEHSAWFVGPTIHYGAEKYWWTLTVLPQVAGWPRNLGADANGVDVADGNLHLQEHERFEVRFMFGIPFGGDHHHD